MSTYKALIFDLGNIVFQTSFSPVYKLLAKHSGLSEAEAEKKIDLDNDTVHHQFERNEASIDTFVEHINELFGIKLSKQEFTEAWNSIYEEPIESCRQLLQSAKGHYRLSALTNTNAVHEPVWRERYKELLSYFDDVFCSNHMGTRKPEIDSYNMVLKQLQLSPEEAVFIDDKDTNVQGAEHAGIKSVKPGSPDELVPMLKALGLEL